MKSEEMFSIFMRRNRTNLDNRTYLLFMRSGYGTPDGLIDTVLLRKEVLNRKILNNYGIGEITVKKICDWLEQEELEDD